MLAVRGLPGVLGVHGLSPPLEGDGGAPPVGTWCAAGDGRTTVEQNYAAMFLWLRGGYGPSEITPHPKSFILSPGGGIIA